MKTAVIGFPRIGKDRELKFASEKYFKGEISEEELKKVASDIRKENLLEQSKQGITYIPVNDFSFYDNVLDTAVLFNVIPKRYKELGLSELDTYFAMARGYQKDKGNVKALAMKKWFNTNYHYIVPEFEDDTKIKLNDETVIERYKEAVSLDIDAKVNLIGPFTFLKLTKFVGSKTIDDVKEKLVLEYVKLLNDIKAAGGKTVSIDEPYLVRDLDSKDKELFNYLYDIILNSNSGVKVILQTYFGDVRDIYDELIKLPFAGIGIDFVEGKESLNLVKKYGFPSDKILFAGLVNGKNIWRNNYRKTIDTFEVIKKALKSDENIVISTSCSLLHVPYTTESETKLQKDYIEHFAFAKEKLVELKEIAALVKLDDFAQKESKCYKDNQNLHASRINSFNKKVKDRVSKIKKSDY